MTKAHLLIAGTLTFNIVLSAALIRSHPEFVSLTAPLLSGGAESESFGRSDTPAPRGLSTEPSALTRSDDGQAYILDTIRANPEAVLDALRILEARSQASAPDDINDVGEGQGVSPALDPEHTDNTPLSGNPDGDVTIVEFFDYNCGYCRQAAPVLDAVVSRDGNIRVLYREYPILTPGSAFAARAALASRAQGLYQEFHSALMAQDGPVDEKVTLEVAGAVGIDIERLKRDIEDPSIVEHLRFSQDLAGQLDVRGTPSFVINGEIAAGAPTEESLEEFIRSVREP